MSLSAILPKPKNIAANKSRWDSDSEEEVKTKKQPEKPFQPPAYGHRQNFIPKSIKDFGDGGAFPEIRVVQYPLDMGRTSTLSTNKKLMTLQTDADGSVRHDLVLHQNKADGKILQSTLEYAKPLEYKESDSFLRPDEETVNQVAERTKEALEQIVNAKIAQANPQAYSKNEAGESEAPKFIKYTPHAIGDENPQTRIIRMSNVQVDPMEPPKFKHKRFTRNDASPPPPVLRSPPRKVTSEEQAAWNIPPCISNWKNPKGYTIPLDKRLAADGRGAQSVTINDNFAKLAEALYVADRHVREEVKLRADMQAKIALKEKKEKEEKLRMLAQKARQERIGVESEEESEVEERDQLRREMQRERERNLLKGLGQDRDISEKIALGVAKPTVSKEAMFDSRLFNQSTTGFGADDSYNMYDKPLFGASSASQIYRPKRSEQGADVGSYEKLLGDRAPHVGFKGADSIGERDGPVQFEKETDDPFGLEQFLTSAKRGRVDDALKDRGTMHASTAGKREDYQSSGSSRRIDFEKKQRTE